MTTLSKDLIRLILGYAIEPIYKISKWAEFIFTERFIHEHELYSNPRAGNLRIDIDIKHLHKIIINPGMIKIIERPHIMEIIDCDDTLQAILFSNSAAIHIIEQKIRTKFKTSLPKNFLLNLCRNTSALYLIERYEKDLTSDCLDQICIYQTNAGDIIFRNKNLVSIWGWIKFLENSKNLQHIKKLLPIVPFRAIKGIYANPLVFKIFDELSIIDSVIKFPERLLEFCSNESGISIIKYLIKEKTELFNICHWSLLSENPGSIGIIEEYILETVKKNRISISLSPFDHIIIKSLFTNKNFHILVEKNPLFIRLIDHYDGWNILIQNPCIFEEDLIQIKGELEKMLHYICSYNI